MNTRLEQEYKNVERENLPKFLAKNLEIDTNWGKSIFGVMFEINLSEEVKDVLAGFQETLETLDLDAFIFPPRPYQHISFNQVVFWNGEYPKGSKGTWEDIGEEFVAGCNSLDGKYKSFDIEFSKFICTNSGIIFCAFDKNDELQTLREEFTKQLPFPKETTKFNHIIHTTVARYKKNLKDPQQVYDYLQTVHPKISMSINEIMLRKALIFPSLKTEELAKIRLSR